MPTPRTPDEMQELADVLVEYLEIQRERIKAAHTHAEIMEIMGEAVQALHKFAEVGGKYEEHREREYQRRNSYTAPGAGIAKL